MDTISVKQLNTYIKSIIEGDRILSDISVRGEISNFTNHYKTGHLYFSLKDDSALIKCVMFRSSAERLRFSPENGQKVIVRGRVGVFERDGQYQIYVNDMSPEGAGDLYLAFEYLKEKLKAEGLFDESLKKPIPRVPGRIGVITSPTGAAVRDIINVTGRRFPLAEIVLYPVLVQGDGAADSICNALDYFSETGSVDVIILGRGGGSIEDLWAFNEEKVARAIHSCNIPVISAVGHETDFTISDFCSDLRAPTPSAGAEIAVPSSEEMQVSFNTLKGRLITILSNLVKTKELRFDALRRNTVFSDPFRFINDKRLLLDSLTMKMTSDMDKRISENELLFKELNIKLSMLSVDSVLDRGYSIIRDDSGKIISSVSDLNINQNVTAMLKDGYAIMTVDKTSGKDN